MSLGDWWLTSSGTPGVIVCGGSGDSVLTAGETLRHMGGETEVVVTQIPRIGEVDPGCWAPGARVVMVGLAVSKPDPQPTRDFLLALCAAGHRLVAVIDEHSACEWERALREVGLDIDSLSVRPETQDGSPFRSAGSVLSCALGDLSDPRGEALLEAADACDRRQYRSNGLAWCVNAVLKAGRDDQARKAGLVRWLAGCARTPELAAVEGRLESVVHWFGDPDGRDAEVLTWVREYGPLEREHGRILEARRDEGDGIVSFEIQSEVDMTVLTQALYEQGARVVLFEGEFFDRAEQRTVRKIGLGADDRGLNLFKALRAGGVHATGYSRKPFLPLEDGLRALEIIREYLRARPPVTAS